VREKIRKKEFVIKRENLNKLKKEKIRDKEKI